MDISGQKKFDILVILFLTSSMAKLSGFSSRMVLIQVCFMIEVSYITGVIKNKVWIKNGSIYRTSRYFTLIADKKVPKLNAVKTAIL